MTVRAKMRCETITTHHWGGSQVSFQSHYDPSIPEDQRFEKATPTAHADFMIENPAALEQFKPGAFYYVDFSPVDAPDICAACGEPIPGDWTRYLVDGKSYHPACRYKREAG